MRRLFGDFLRVLKLKRVSGRDDFYEFAAKLHDSSVVHSSGSACYINYKIEMCFGSQYPCDV